MYGPMNAETFFDLHFLDAERIGLKARPKSRLTLTRQQSEFFSHTS